MAVIFHFSLNENVTKCRIKDNYKLLIITMPGEVSESGDLSFVTSLARCVALVYIMCNVHFVRHF
jgi:hypothetical protein